jgi:transposase InsO family protein
MDIIGPLSPPSSEGHRYILSIVDMATRFPEAIPLKNIDTISVAEALVSVFARVGIPREILSDRGAQFTSDLMGEIDRLLTIKPIFTTAYNPACNGMCERQNGVIKTILRKLCRDHPRDWHRYIPACLFACREIPHGSLGFSPFELLYGRRVRGPLTLLKELWGNNNLEPAVRNTYQYVFDLRQKLEETAKLAASNSETSSSLYKSYFDKNSQPQF